MYFINKNKKPTIRSIFLNDTYSEPVTVCADSDGNSYHQQIPQNQRTNP